MKKNEFCEIEITGMTAEGNGVGRAPDGMAVFVPSTAVGDVISCKIVKAAKSCLYGIIDRIITPSPYRGESGCPVSEKCGGCTFRHMTYEAELAVKDKLVRDAFERIGGFKDIPFEEIKGGRTECYRNKAQYPVSERDGIAVCGFYSKRSHRVVPYTECGLQPKIFGDIASFCLNEVNRRKIPAYNEENGSGILRHIYLRQGFHSGEIMLCFVVKNGAARLPLTEIAESAAEKFSEIKSVVMNVNSKNTNVIMGTETVLLCGRNTITDIMCENKIELSPASFYQVNTEQAEALYRQAIEYAAPKGGEVLLDLYCGAGTISLAFANTVKKVIGCEIVPEAVDNARRNASLNKISNAEFFCGDAGKLAEKLADEGICPDIAVTDPPRRGCDKLTLDGLLRMSPKKIVMISCDPATAARDVKYLAEQGYKPVKAWAFDLFPRTGHVETIVLLQRENL